MTCDELECLWNDRLDARGGLEPPAEGHLASCEPCRVASDRFEVLRQAIEAHAAPVPSRESRARLLAAMHKAAVPDERRAVRFRSRFAWIPLASAATILGFAWLGGLGPQAPTGVPSPVAVKAAPARPLGSALAEATSTSIDLAREASESAARIGREVLGEAEDAAVPPEPPAAVVASASAPDLLQSVGERLNAGVKPISGSARHAFSFLQLPAPEQAPAGPAARGSL